MLSSNESILYCKNRGLWLHSVEVNMFSGDNNRLCVAFGVKHAELCAVTASCDEGAAESSCCTNTSITE